MGEELQFSEQARDAFLLGCQGPDPFFFTVRSARIVDRRRFGSHLQAENIAKSIDVFRMASIVKPEDRQEAMQAYVRGWLAHLSLDSLAHPLIFYWEQVLVNAGVKGLAPDAAREVHAQIESDLDAMLLQQKHEVTIRDFRPMNEVLLASSKMLDWIGVMYRRVAAEVFAIKLPASAFRTAVQDMRLSYKTLYSPQGVKRSILGRMERIFRKHSMAQATSHRVDVGESCDFDNHQHEAWENPFTGEKSTASFMDLYSTALEICATKQRLLTTRATSSEIAGPLNFAGSPVG
jgi:hypothetical protein